MAASKKTTIKLDAVSPYYQCVLRYQFSTKKSQIDVNVIYLLADYMLLKQEKQVSITHLPCLLIDDLCVLGYSARLAKDLAPETTSLRSEPLSGIKPLSTKYPSSPVASSETKKFTYSCMPGIVPMWAFFT